MPVNRDTPHAPAGNGLLGWADAAAARADQRRRYVAGDVLLADDARLDERTRSAVRERLSAVVGAIERELRLGAAQRLTARAATGIAAAIANPGRSLLAVLTGAGMLTDADLICELIGQVGLAQLATDFHAVTGGNDRPSLLVRLADCPEPPVADAATRLLAAINDARSGVPVLSDPYHAPLCWAVAAALAREAGGDADQAVVEATLDLLGSSPALDEQVAATALARAIAARPDELGDLMLEALGTHAPALFVALLAEAVALPATAVRDALLDRDAARLLVMLHAAGLARDAMARIGVALAQADPRRDLERFADLLDASAAVSQAEAAAALAPLAWPLPFRRARRALEAA